MTTLVTVVVPVHDVIAYLDDCMASIATQSHAHLEIVLVDDGSSDGSEDLCDEWAARDSRVRVIHQEARGSSVARNAGIELATGEYVMFADSDDVLSPELVGTLLAMIEATGAEIALADLVPFADGTAPTFTVGSGVSVSAADDELDRIINVRPQWGPVAKLFRRELFVDGPRFIEGILHQDLAFTPQVFHRSMLCARTDAVLYGYRQRPGSVTDTVHRVAFSPDLVTVLRTNIEFARTTQPPAAFERYLTTYLRHASRHLERIGPEDAWRRNEPFVRAYRSLIADYVAELPSASLADAGRRVAWRFSAVAPRPYAVSARLARRIRSVLAGAHRFRG